MTASASLKAERLSISHQINISKLQPSSDAAIFHWKTSCIKEHSSDYLNFLVRAHSTMTKHKVNGLLKCHFCYKIVAYYRADQGVAKAEDAIKGSFRFLKLIIQIFCDCHSIVLRHSYWVSAWLRETSLAENKTSYTVNSALTKKKAFGTINTDLLIYTNLWNIMCLMLFFELKDIQ